MAWTMRGDKVRAITAFDASSAVRNEWEKRIENMGSKPVSIRLAAKDLALACDLDAERGCLTKRT